MEGKSSFALGALCQVAKRFLEFTRCEKFQKSSLLQIIKRVISRSCQSSATRRLLLPRNRNDIHYECSVTTIEVLSYTITGSKMHSFSCEVIRAKRANG